MSKPRQRRFQKVDPRKGHSGGQIVTWGRRQVPVPELAAGQKRCPVCRNGVRVTVNGFLRKHRDLFGDDCANKNTGEPVDFGPTPPVVVPPNSVPPRPGPQGPQMTGVPVRLNDGGPNRLPAAGVCHTCGRVVSGRTPLLRTMPSQEDLMTVNGRTKRRRRAERDRNQPAVGRGFRDPWGGMCPNGCGEPGPHFVPPSFGDRGFYTCTPAFRKKP